MPLKEKYLGHLPVKNNPDLSGKWKIEDIYKDVGEVHQVIDFKKNGKVYYKHIYKNYLVTNTSGEYRIAEDSLYVLMDTRIDLEHYLFSV